MFSGKRDELLVEASRLSGLNEALLSQIEDLRADKVALQVQVSELQQALVAKTSPELYRNNVASELLKNPVWEAEAKRQREETQVMSDYVRIMESDSIISSKEDLDLLFLKGIGHIDAPASLTPENSES